MKNQFLPASRKSSPRTVVLLLLAVCTSTLYGEIADSSRLLTAHRTQERITIDGQLTEKIWQREGFDGFIQREPNEGAEPSERTVVWFAYDEHALYVAARMYDRRPDSIVALLARRDVDSESDLFRVGIDAEFSRRTAHYFQVNPAGAIEDGTLSNDTRVDAGWDGIWDVAAQIDQEGWTAEFRIPFSQLRFTKKEKYIWGIECKRRIKRRNEESFMVLHPRSDFIRVSRWLELHGIEGIDPPSRVELLPYVVATSKFLEQPPVSSFNAGRKDPFIFGRDYTANVGADAKIGLTGSLTLDAALNPDFAQVEVDPAVVNLTAYEVRYQEKRPFFTEGSAIFDNFGRGGAVYLQNYNWTNPTFFYSRRIGRAPQGSVTHAGFLDIPDRTTILGAAKVSGRIDPSWSIAAVTALTDREYGRVDSAGVRFREEIEPLTFYGTLRTLKEFDGARHAVGILATYTDRSFREQRLESILNRRALSVGIDGWTFLDEQRYWVVTGWGGASRVEGTPRRMTALQRSSVHFFQRPDADHVEVDPHATSLSGWAGRIWLDKVKGNFIFNAALGAIHPKFDVNDVGFLTAADIVNGHLFIGYQWLENDGTFRHKEVTGTVYRTYNFGGVLTRYKYEWYVNLQFVNFWRALLRSGYDLRTLDDQRSRGGPLMESPAVSDGLFQVTTDPRRPLIATAFVQGSSSQERGWVYSSSLSLNWRVSKTLQLQGGPSFFRFYSKAQYVTSIADPYATATFGRRYIFGTLDQQQLAATLRVNWTFTPRLSFQLFLQPLFSIGDYSGLKELAKPRTFNFNRYGEKGSTITLSNNRYTIDPDGGFGPAPSFTIINPNFNYKSLRANAVLRWEYLPGSTLYFVWTNEKVNFESRGDFEFGRDVRSLLRDRPDNVFSLKLTYWMNP